MGRVRGIQKMQKYTMGKASALMRINIAMFIPCILSKHFLLYSLKSIRMRDKYRWKCFKRVAFFGQRVVQRQSLHSVDTRADCYQVQSDILKPLCVGTKQKHADIFQ